MSPGEYRVWKKFADYTKSVILSQASRVEDLMCSHMALRFASVPDDINKFYRIFFETNRISFHGKIELYKQYMKDYEPEWLEQHRDFFKKLETLNQTRNDLAHGINPLEEDVEHIKDITKYPVVLLYTVKKGEMVKIEFTQEEIDKIIKNQDNIITDLFYHYKKIAKQKSVDITKIIGKSKYSKLLSDLDSKSKN